MELISIISHYWLYLIWYTSYSLLSGSVLRFFLYINVTLSVVYQKSLLLYDSNLIFHHNWLWKQLVGSVPIFVRTGDDNYFEVEIITIYICLGRIPLPSLILWNPRRIDIYWWPHFSTLSRYTTVNKIEVIKLIRTEYRSEVFATPSKYRF